MKTDIMVPWTVSGSARRPATITLEVPDNASSDAPLVVLLHGTNGDRSDMSDPAVHPGSNYERIEVGTVVDRGWHAYPNAGYWSLGADQLTGVTGWAPFLAAAGYPTINYSQFENAGVLVEPLRELRAILDAIATDPQFLAVRDRSIILMGHSRGGILARLLLVELAAAGAPLLGRISTCITLHTPNQGSTVANAALALSSILTTWRLTGVPLVPPELQLVALLLLDDLLARMAAEAGAPAYTDFVVGAPTLLFLTASEPVRGVTYFTFGGTRPVLLNLRGWAFTPGSAIPMAHDPPFHWRSVYVPLLPLPPPGALPFPELLEGGDLLTNSLHTRLPFGLHRDNRINHAEALWDDEIKSQVLAILAGAPRRRGACDIAYLWPLLLSDPPLPHANAPDMSYLVPLLLSSTQ